MDCIHCKKDTICAPVICRECYDKLLAKIDQLRAENRNIKQNSVSMNVYQQVCTERDAAVEDLKNRILGNGSACTYCKYCNSPLNDTPCCECDDIPDTRMPTKWQWRGPQKEE